jgi:hypothetical protein
MPSIASLIVRIGAQDQEIQNALASIGQKAKSVDADLRKLGNAPLGGAAQRSLDNLKGTLNQITQAQERVAERGRLAAQGLEAIGGATRLTDAQLKQVNRTLQDGLSAYRALGKEPPAILQRIAAETRNAATGTEGLKASLKNLGGAIAAAFTVQAVIGFGRELLRMADDIVRVSARTGLLTDEVQRLSFIAKQSGNSIDELVGAIGQMQNRLAEGEGSAVSAVTRLGLSFEQLRQAGPYEQLELIAEAIAKIPNPAQRSQIAVDLFGRSGLAILPTLTAEFKKLGDEAPVMAHNTVVALDQAGDALDKFQLQVKVFAANSYNTLSKFFDQINAFVLRSTATFLDVSANIASLAQKVPGVGTLFPGFAKELQDVRDRAQFARDAAHQLSTMMNQSGQEARKAAPGFTGMAEAIEQVGAKSKTTGADMQRFRAVQDQLFGRTVIANAEELVRALGSTENLTKLTEGATQKLHQELGEALEVYRALGREVPPRLQEIYNRTASIVEISSRPIRPTLGVAPDLSDLPRLPPTLTAVTKDYTAALIASQVEVNALGRVIAVDLEPKLGKVSIAFEETKEKAATFTDVLRDIPTTLAAAFTGGGGLSGAIKAIGAQMGDALFGEDGTFATVTKTATAGLSRLFGKTIGGSLGAAIPGIGALIGPALESLFGGVKKLFDKFFGTAGRDAIREFAKGFSDNGELQSGFDALHERLATLGARGEELWVTLTQGVGRNNAEGAKAAIDEVTKALDAQERQMEENKRKYEEMQGALTDIGERLRSVTTITPGIQAALEQVFNAKTPDGYLKAIQDLNGELDQQAKKYDTIKSTLSKYNIDVSAAGPQFKQETININSKEIIDDFIVLRDAGVEINTQMRGMGEQIRDFIQDAQKAGVEVPNSMKSIIQHAIDAGEVFDADGKKITDMSQLGLTFGDTMETVMTVTIPNAIAQLTAVLQGIATFLGIRLPEAAQTGAAGVQGALDGITPPPPIPITADADPAKAEVDGFVPYVNGIPLVPIPVAADTGPAWRQVDDLKVHYDGFFKYAEDRGPLEITAHIDQAREELAKLGTRLQVLDAEFARTDITDDMRADIEAARQKVFAEIDRIQAKLNGITTRDLEIHLEVDTSELRKIPREFDYRVPGAATGGLVKPWGIQTFQHGGIAGTDTIPALLTPGEIVLNAAQQRNVAGAIDDRSQPVAINFYGPVLAAEQYVKDHLIPPILDGMERTHLRRVSRLVRLAEGV